MFFYSILIVVLIKYYMKNIHNGLIVLGAVIGAGFATGKEVFVFYARYGYVGIITAIMSMYLFYIMVKRYLEVGRLYSDRVYSNRYRLYQGYKAVGLIIVSSALFGAGNEVELCSGVVGIIILVLTICLVVGGIDRISKFNIYIVPIMIIVLICVDGMGIYKNMGEYDYVYDNNILFALIKSISYIGINTMLISDILIDMGKNVSPVKVAMWGSALFGSILIFSITSVMCLPNELVISDMPLYEMIKGGFISKVYNVLLVIAIITSVTATIYGVCKYTSKWIRNTKLNVIIVCVMCYLFSLFGFGKIVEYLYPIIGVLGILYFARLNRIYKSIKIHKTA